MRESARGYRLPMMKAGGVTRGAKAAVMLLAGGCLIASSATAFVPTTVPSGGALGRLSVSRACRTWSAAVSSPVQDQRARPTRLWASVQNKERMQTEVDEKVLYKDALQKTALSIGAALAFGAGVWALKGGDSGIEYFAGYLVEQSLSVDNLFVFLLLFQYFKVPTEHQGRVLTWGIFGAMIMRFLMVIVGVEALEHFRVVLLGFAAVLVASSVKLLAEDDDDEDADLSNNEIVRFAKRLVKTGDTYDGGKFFTEVDGLRVATPLLLVLICVELSDVVFAVDSVPAVFGVTKDPFIVYTSNIFAILGLRSMYTVLANAMLDLPYLKPAVALILGFVGVKLGAEYFGHEMSNVFSLGVIVSLLSAGVGASLMAREKSA